MPGEGKEPVQESVYNRVFCSEFNLSFHQARKDACARCEQYNSAEPGEITSLEHEYRWHITVTEVCAAPAEGNTLLDFMLDTNDEPLLFLTKFYYDRSGLTHTWDVALATKKSLFNNFWTATNTFQVMLIIFSKHGMSQRWNRYVTTLLLWCSWHHDMWVSVLFDSTWH